MGETKQLWRIHGNQGDLTYKDVFVMADSIDEALATARENIDPKSIVWRVALVQDGRLLTGNRRREEDD